MEAAVPILVDLLVIRQQRTARAHKAVGEMRCVARRMVQGSRKGLHPQPQLQPQRLELPGARM